MKNIVVVPKGWKYQSVWQIFRKKISNNIMSHHELLVPLLIIRVFFLDGHSMTNKVARHKQQVNLTLALVHFYEYAFEQLRRRVAAYPSKVSRLISIAESR